MMNYLSGELSTSVINIVTMSVGSGCSFGKEAIQNTGIGSDNTEGCRMGHTQQHYVW